MTAKIIFGIIVSLDLFALGFVYILGMGFAGQSSFYSTRVVLIMLPSAGVLAASVILFLSAKSPVWQGVAFFLAVMTVPVLVGSEMYAKGKPGDHAEYEFNERNQRTEYELERAIKSGDINAVKKALPKADINAQTGARNTVLIIALNKVDDTGKGLDVLKAVLGAGADPNVNAGILPLPLERAIQNSRSQGIEPMVLLLNAGAKPNLGSIHDVPAFFAAMEGGIDLSVIKVLVERGADVTLLDKLGQSPLDYAIGNRNWPVALYLLEKNPTISDDVMKRLESARQKYGDGDGLAELIAFVKKASRGKK